VDPETSLELRVLGELTAARDRVPIDLGGLRQRAVLAALLIHRSQVVAADRLADLVWGGRPPTNPTGALQAYISHLRRRLQPEAAARRRGDVIVRAGNGYLLRLAPDAVDAWRFESVVDSTAGLAPSECARALGDALRLWRGPAYAEYAGQTWVEAEVTRLDALRAVARERLLEARLQFEDAARLVGDLEAMVAEDPLREERWRLLVLALYRAQRQADALAALRRARALLADELGVDPGPALRSLEAEVLAQSPSLDAPPVAPPVVRLSTPAAPAEAPSSDLIDRVRELALLRLAVEGLAAGAPAWIQIDGPAGIGKTRLLVETVRMAEAAGARTLSARASELERSHGFGVVRQLFEPVVRDPSLVDGLFEGAANGARVVFDGLSVVEGASHGNFAVLHGLYWLTVNLAGQGPVLLTIDDAQWCDPASLRFLAYLVKRLEGLPVLVVLTVRSGEDGPEGSLIAELTLDPSVTVLRPRPLSPESAGMLVHELLGEGADSFVRACHRMTSGNPLLLRQLLRALEEEGVRPDVAHVDTVRAVGSRAVSSLVMLRLRRMPPAVTAVARAVAVLGEDAQLPAVADLARLSEEDAAGAIDTLSRSEILLNRLPLAFVHPLVRDAVYGDVPSADRALHHERAAQLLQAGGAAPDAVATHLLLAPSRGDEGTVVLLRAAARQAMARGASDSAVVLLRRALDERPPSDVRAEVLIELGLVETLVDGPASAEHLTEAYSLVDDPHERARIAMLVVRTHIFASPPGVATTFALEVEASLPDGLDDERQGLVALRRMSGYMHRLPPESYAAGPVSAVKGDGDGARMLAATLCYELLRDGEDREGAIALARFALEEDRLLEIDNGLLWIIAADVLLVADADLGDFWDRALAHARATGGLFAVLSVNLWRGFTFWRKGQLDDALQSLADATEQMNMWGASGITETYAAAFTIGVQVDQGDLDGASQTLDGARCLPRLGEGARLLAESAARLRLAQDRPAEALEEITELVEQPGIANPAWAPWRGLKGRALAGVGQSEEAVRLVSEEVTLLRRWGAATSLGPALRVLGELLGPSGTAYLREAVELLSGSEATLEFARAQTALGCSREVGDHEAIPLLRAALAAARACGARSVAQDAAQELALRGHRPEESSDDSGPRLTIRQRRVLELAADGLEVNEVAQRLFLTPGTVRAVLESVGGGSP
jgi:DNA-binding SARP family transcriptional activator